MWISHLRDKSLKRILASSKYGNVANRLLKKYRPDIIYTEGLDSLSIAVRTHEGALCKIIYEVAGFKGEFH